MDPPPLKPTRPATLFPYTTLFRSVGIGVGAPALIMARQPAARRTVARFAADAVLGGNRARRARGAVATEAHLRLRRIADAEIARDELAAVIVQHRDRKSTRLNSSH